MSLKVYISIRHTMPELHSWEDHSSSFGKEKCLEVLIGKSVIHMQQK